MTISCWWLRHFLKTTGSVTNRQVVSPLTASKMWPWAYNLFQGDPFVGTRSIISFSSVPASMMQGALPSDIGGIDVSGDRSNTSSWYPLQPWMLMWNGVTNHCEWAGEVVVHVVVDVLTFSLAFNSLSSAHIRLSKVQSSSFTWQLISNWSSLGSFLVSKGSRWLPYVHVSAASPKDLMLCTCASTWSYRFLRAEVFLGELIITWLRFNNMCVCGVIICCLFPNLFPTRWWLHGSWRMRVTNLQWSLLRSDWLNSYDMWTCQCLSGSRFCALHIPKGWPSGYVSIGGWELQLGEPSTKAFGSFSIHSVHFWNKFFLIYQLEDFIVEFADGGNLFLQAKLELH